MKLPIAEDVFPLKLFIVVKTGFVLRKNVMRLDLRIKIVGMSLRNPEPKQNVLRSSNIGKTSDFVKKVLAAKQVAAGRKTREWRMS